MVSKKERIDDVLDNNSYDASDVVGNLRVAAQHINEQTVDSKDALILLASTALDKKADKSSVQAVWAACEKSFAPRNVEHVIADLVKKLDTMPSKNDFLTLSNFITAHVEQGPSPADLVSSIGLLSTNLNKLNLAVTALAAKLDTDFTAQNAAVTGSTLDVDYETTITTALT